MHSKRRRKKKEFWRLFLERKKNYGRLDLSRSGVVRAASGECQTPLLASSFSGPFPPFSFNTTNLFFWSQGHLNPHLPTSIVHPQTGITGLLIPRKSTARRGSFPFGWAKVNTCGKFSNESRNLQSHESIHIIIKPWINPIIKNPNFVSHVGFVWATVAHRDPKVLLFRDLVHKFDVLWFRFHAERWICKCSGMAYFFVVLCSIADFVEPQRDPSHLFSPGNLKSSLMKKSSPVNGQG